MTQRGNWGSGLVILVASLGFGSMGCGTEPEPLAQVVQGSFDWGGDCDSGSGEFAQQIPYRSTTTVGEIPANKRNVVINLVSNQDVDIQLVDQATGHQIIAWPYGDLNGAGEATTEYQGVTYKYSGYNGVDGELGHEFIEILGDTNRPLVMRAYGYAAGPAEVIYAWEAVPTCREKGAGSFQQYVPYRNLVTVGSIPMGKTNIHIELRAAGGKDVDIQLVDDSNGHQIIAWPNGDLNGPGPGVTSYQGMTIEYSGYNGENGNWGWETIDITGETTAVLTMKAYGYAAGNAVVDYQWGVGVGALCEGGTIQPPLPPCTEGLRCKREMLILSKPGVCHTTDWCLNDEMAFYHCGHLEAPATPGRWGCNQFECYWQEQNECESKGGICTLFTETCPTETYPESPMGCPAGRSGQCCLPLGAEISLSRDDDGTTITANRGDVLVLRLDRGPVHACYGGVWQDESIMDGGILRLLSHEVVANPDCPGTGCYHEMDELRLVVRDTGSPETGDFSIDMGPAPDWCDNDIIGVFRFHIIVP